MTQEEKAKAYDNALEIAKGLYAKDAPDSLHLERMFPKLKESEDENIRKAIHIYFDWLDGRKDYQPKGEYTIRDMVAWLEKQGEQDPYNGVSFKYNGHTWGMCARDNGVDILLDRQFIKHLEKQGAQKQYPCNNCKDIMLNCHNFPCTKKRAFKQGKSVFDIINEEKVDNANKVEPKFHEGDWLCENAPNNYARFIQILEIVNLQGKERYRISRDIHNDEDIVECRFIENDYHSFTIADAKAGDVLVYKENIKGSNGIKYERICLFNNFDNAFFILTTVSNDVEGYDIDVNINYPDDTIPATKEQREQLKKAMADARYTFDFDKKKKLKKVEQKPAWSYEDEANLNNIIWLCNNCIKGSETTWIPSQATKIKHLIETIKEKGLVQQNPAWSEEDKKTLERVIRCIENHDYMNVDDIQWLKSIKDRCTWRPSDEQMKAFENFVRGIWESCYDSPYENKAKLLYSLLSDLKKLRKE